MSRIQHIATYMIIFFMTTLCFAQEKIAYKQVDSTTLFMEVFQPEKMDTTKTYPALVFFFGGGWNGGSIKQFEPHARYFYKRGIVCFLVDYRVKNRQKTSPFEALKDAKSAIRFIRSKAVEFHIDNEKIIGSGGSAGGHLAAATATIENYNEAFDDLSISCIPNALILFNPVIDNGPGGYGYERIGDAYKNFSPLHNIKKGAPPTLLFLGTKDALIPVETVEYYKTVMTKVGSQCELRLYKDHTHGFFNYRNFEIYKQTILEADEFLSSLGYLKTNPVVKIN